MDKVVLIQNFYMNPKRKKEIYFCLEQNIKNKYIDDIVLLTGSDCIDPEYINEKVELITGYDRPSFKEIFLFANQRYINGEIIILSNLDIFFDDTLFHIKNLNNWDKDVMAVTRWEYNGDKHVFYLGWDYSQDCWIWKTPIEIGNMECEFPLGKPGCDNRMAYELGKNYNVINPCKTVRANHYHICGYREYTPGDLKETIPEPHKRVSPMSLKGYK